jgi:hypothetical protein
VGTGFFSLSFLCPAAFLLTARQLGALADNVPLEVWVQRPDASGARTPPNLEKADLGSSNFVDVAGLDDAEEAELSSVSLSLKDSIGSLARRMHEHTPPESPRNEAATAEAPKQAVTLRLPPGVEVRAGILERPVGRARSASVTDDIRTPPDSPPSSPPIARSMSPPPMRLMGGSSESATGSPNSPFRWGERLLISPDAPEPPAPLRASVARFTLIDSHSSDLSVSGPHATEIGFKRSEKALGQGAFGKVWLGLRDNGEFLAIKEIQLAQGEKYAERLEAVENEIELMRNLDHPHIVRYLGSRRDLARGAFYILLEYVSCGSIQALLKTMGGPLDERVIRKYSRQILQGLAYLHGCNPPVAHRDIK